MRIFIRNLCIILYSYIILSVFIILIINNILKPYNNIDDRVYIRNNMSTYDISEELYTRGYISSKYLFSILVKITGKTLKSGEYEFPRHASMLKIISKIIDGDVYLHKITIPEGLYTSQIIDILNQDIRLSGDKIGALPEGYFLPNTYKFPLYFDRVKIANLMHKKLVDLLQTEFAKYYNNMGMKPYKTISDVLIMASIIEKESSDIGEYSLISSVFANRLKKGMRLQSDPTVIYAMTGGKEIYSKRVMRKDLGYESPFNTYLHHGLPPSPICNPGEKAIIAAMNPADTRYLYFVSDGNGGHIFSENYDDHLKNVKSYYNILSSSNIK